MPNSISIERFQELFQTQLSTEQIAAVTAPLDSTPNLVVAGAGSGKTKVMALRAVWLVASQQLQPAEVIGLTFTRRAASELEKRMQQYLSTLKATALNPPSSRFWPDEIPQDAELPRVSTYNSFAVELFEQRAIALGYEPDAQTLGEADAFRLARKIALNPESSFIQRLTESDMARDTVIDAMLTLSGELADNNQTPESAREYLIGLQAQLESTPLVAKGNGRNKYFDDLLTRLNDKILISDLAAEYQKMKVALGYLEYSDQVLLALKAAQLAPFDHGFRAVLLDEYQDTSPIQAQLLATVFRGSSVMAVGDPRQAIYGWRGASTANLSEFFKHFQFADGAPGRLFDLTVNWRSDRAIVDAANVTAQTITSGIRDASGKTLESRGNDLAHSPNAEAGRVWVSITQHQNAEAGLVAEWFRERISKEPDATAAILFRSRRYMAHFAQALERCGVRYSIYGLGGILEMPEVTDLVSALRVIYEVDSGIYLMRLLAGPRWRIGPGDIAALGSYASNQTRNREEFDDGPALTLTEALDDLLVLKTAPTGMTKVGFGRLREAADLFRKMRSFFGLGLSEIARLIAEELQLDIEILANSIETGADPLRNLNAFYRILDDYENRAVRPSMSDFLEWLNYAVEHERLEPPSATETKGLVQLLTVHAAKGLEWQYVAIPNLVKDQFPAKSRDNSGWLTHGKLPFELRQDATGLPELRFNPGDSQTEIKATLDSFKNEMANHRLAEERRVAYVAVTRAERELLLSASYWRRGLKNPDDLSEFLTEQIEQEHLVFFGDQASGPVDTNPLDVAESSVTWPQIASPDRIELLGAASRLVDQASPAAATEHVAQLLEERRRRLEAASPLLPRRLSASAVVALMANPESFAQRIARPEPGEFSAAAKLGTEVHAALETAFTGEDSINYLSGLTQQSDASAVSELLRAFLESDNSQRTPELVEHEIEFVLGPLIVTCKIDAVFKHEFGHEIVDWKTGAPPKDAAELEQRSVQLAVYRVALAALLHEPIERITAGFFFLSTGERIIPGRLDSKAQLEAKLARAFELLAGT